MTTENDPKLELVYDALYGQYWGLTNQYSRRSNWLYRMWLAWTHNVDAEDIA